MLKRDPLNGRFLKKTLPEKFWDKVKKTDGCWEWIGAKCSNGYGTITIVDSNYRHLKTLLAHRVSWELHHGAIPKGLVVCHKCDNPYCVNPEHLFLGTQKDNLADMYAKGRNPKPFIMRGEKNTQAKLTEKQVLEIRKKYKPREVTVKQLSREYGVSIPTIEKILSFKIWKHLREA